MSVSIDYRDVETLRQFEAFFEFIRNPDKYRSTVESVQTTLKELDAAVGVYKTVVLAEQYLAKAKNALSKIDTAEKESLDKVRKAEEVFKVNKLEWESKLTVKQEGLAKQAAELRAMDIDLKTRDTQSTLMRERLEKKSGILDLREQALVTREKTLDEKAAKVKEILG